MFIPKYKQIEQHIVEEIEKEKVKPGDKLKPDDFYAKLFGVSNLTVRKAIVNLAESGYIERIPGKGSFISHELPFEIKQLKTFSSLSEDIRSLGKEPGSKLLFYSVEPADNNKEIFDKLQLKEGDLVHYFTRVRFADDEAIAYTITYIPVNIVENMDLNSLNSGSLMKYLQSTGLQATEYSNIKMKAVLPSDEMKKELLIKDEPLLLCDQLSYTNENIPYKYVQTFFVSSRFDYKYTSYTTFNKDI